MRISDKWPWDKRPLSQFFIVLKLTRQTNESNFLEFYARTLSRAVSEPLACVVDPATIKQHLLMTSFAEYKKIKNNRFNKLHQQKLPNYLRLIV